MDAKTRAEKILNEVLRGPEPSQAMIDWVEGRIEAAKREAFDDGYKTGYGDRHEAVEKIRAEGFRAGRAEEYKGARELLDKYIEKSYTEGFNAARDKAKGIAMEQKEICFHTCGFEIAQRIGELEP